MTRSISTLAELERLREMASPGERYISEDGEVMTRYTEPDGFLSIGECNWSQENIEYAIAAQNALPDLLAIAREAQQLINRTAEIGETHPAYGFVVMGLPLARALARIVDPAEDDSARPRRLVMIHDNDELRRLAEKVQANAIAAGNNGNHLAEGVMRLLAAVDARDSIIEAMKVNRDRVIMDRNREIAARDEKIARLSVELDCMTGPKCGRAAVTKPPVLCNFHLRLISDEEIARLKKRAALLGAALQQAALDIGNAAAFFMLAGMRDEAAVFRKCDEAARAALADDKMVPDRNGGAR